jgi:hypothetical protein
VARWAESAKWGAAPALDGQRDAMLALRLTDGLGSTAFLGDIAQLYGKRDRLPPGFGLPRPDNHAALTTPSDHAAKRYNYFLGRQLGDAMPTRAATWPQRLGRHAWPPAGAIWVLPVGKPTAGLANAEGRERCVANSTCIWLGHNLSEWEAKKCHIPT